MVISEASLDTTAIWDLPRSKLYFT